MSDKLSFTEFERCVERGKAIDGEQLFNLVYTLHEENEQLKESNERFSKTVAEQIIMIKEYREENGQLKEEIKDLNDILARYEEKELIE